jgi:transposase
LEPCLEEAQRGERTVFFVDAAHFVLGGFLATLWSLGRCWVKAPAGRQRFNVLGALNAITHEVITITNADYINAQSVCALLEKVAASAIKTAITLIMDNARYQRCTLVQARAAELGIEILFLPSYSPNLNLIERLWKFVRKRCLYGKYYADFATFSTAIDSLIKTAQELYADELKSLLTLEFQSFPKCNS